MYPVIDMEATGIRLRRIMEQKKNNGKMHSTVFGIGLCTKYISMAQRAEYADDRPFIRFVGTFSDAAR